MKLAGIAGAAALALSLAACGGSTQVSTVTVKAAPVQTATVRPVKTTAPMTRAQAVTAYQAAIAPPSAISHSLTSRTKGKSPAQLQQLIQQLGPSFAPSLQTSDGKLLILARRYPPAATDLRALVSADAPYAADLETGGIADDFSQWLGQTARDAATDGIAASVVTSALGLPQSS